MEYANEGKEGVQQRRRRRGESGVQCRAEGRVGWRKSQKTAKDGGGDRRRRAKGKRGEGRGRGLFSLPLLLLLSPSAAAVKTPSPSEGGRAAVRPAGTLPLSFLERRCVGASVVVRDFRQWWGVGERGPHTCACHAAACLGLFTTLPPQLGW